MLEGQGKIYISLKDIHSIKYHVWNGTKSVKRWRRNYKFERPSLLAKIL